MEAWETFAPTSCRIDWIHQLFSKGTAGLWFGRWCGTNCTTNAPIKTYLQALWTVPRLLLMVTRRWLVLNTVITATWVSHLSVDNPLWPPLLAIQSQKWRFRSIPATNDLLLPPLGNVVVILSIRAFAISRVVLCMCTMLYGHAASWTWPNGVQQRFQVLSWSQGWKWCQKKMARLDQIGIHFCGSHPCCSPCIQSGYCGGHFNFAANWNPWLSWSPTKGNIGGSSCWDGTSLQLAVGIRQNTTNNCWDETEYHQYWRSHCTKQCDHQCSDTVKNVNRKYDCTFFTY